MCKNREENKNYFTDTTKNTKNRKRNKMLKNITI